MPDNKNQYGSWQLKSRELVYENPWISVTHDEVVTPGQTEGIYGMVHFKSTAVGIIPIDQQGYTWLVRQHRYTLGEDSWEIPMGGAPLGESLLEHGARELQEETGLSARSWKQVLKLHTSNSVTDESGVVYLATDLAQGPQSLEPSEDIVTKRILFGEAVQWALDGRITDAISVAGLLAVHHQMAT